MSLRDETSRVALTASTPFGQAFQWTRDPRAPPELGRGSHERPSPRQNFPFCVLILVVGLWVAVPILLVLSCRAGLASPWIPGRTESGRRAGTIDPAHGATARAHAPEPKGD
jgi:hypothetical protein